MKSECVLQVIYFEVWLEVHYLLSGHQSQSVWQSVQLIVLSLDRLGCLGDTRDDSAELLYQSFLQEAIVSSSGMGRDVHYLMLSIKHFLCWPQHHPPSKVPGRMVWERLSWCVTCPNHASFHHLTVVRRDFCGPTRKLILPCTKSLVLCSNRRCREVSSGTWFWKPGSFFQS